MPDSAVNAEMVVLARESRGYTQGQLAEALGVRQGTLSKIEAGLLAVSDDLLGRLSTELGYPLSFFRQADRVYGPGLGELFHRKKQDVPSKVLAKIHATANIRRMQIARLLRAVEFDPPKIVPIDVDEYDGDIEAIARMVRASWRLPGGPVPNLCRAIEDAGGLIVPCKFETRRVDAVSQWAPGLPPLFLANMAAPQDRLRFTLAHELGHLVMHRAPDQALEQQADRFAAEFLMPADAIRPSLRHVTLARLASLKPLWRVSMAALLRRARDLGTISERQYRTLWTQMGAAGYRTREPAEFDIRGEEPSLLGELVQVHITDLGFSIDELAGCVNLDEEEFRSDYLPKAHGLRLVSMPRQRA
jgi:Zn-dependent peptidase ImmA (M78 family)/transcriptional regulator with XRE-family HTH domain